MTKRPRARTIPTPVRVPYCIRLANALAVALAGADVEEDAVGRISLLSAAEYDPFRPNGQPGPEQKEVLLALVVGYHTIETVAPVSELRLMLIENAVRSALDAVPEEEL
jgi:hypothetical protein